MVFHKRNWEEKAILSEGQAKDFLSAMGSLGDDIWLKNRSKSIAYFKVESGRKFSTLPHDYFIQPTSYNGTYHGGVMRKYERLPAALTNSPLMNKILRSFVDRFKDSIKAGTTILCQVQTSTEYEDDGDVTGQGIHTDGADMAMILCLERKNCQGAFNSFYADKEGWDCLMKPRILREGKAVFWKDNKIYHSVSNLCPTNIDAGPAIRTVMILHADGDMFLHGRLNKRNSL